MNKTSQISQNSFTLAELCVLADMAVRTVRYYVQIGLVDKPEGETRAAKYSERQLGQLLLIKRWTGAGVSLDRVRELLQGEEAPIPPRTRQPGSIEVCSHLNVADGIQVIIEPSRAGMSPDQVRRFVREVMQLHELIMNGDEYGAGKQSD